MKSSIKNIALLLFLFTASNQSLAQEFKATGQAKAKVISEVAGVSYDGDYITLHLSKLDVTKLQSGQEIEFPYQGNSTFKIRSQPGSVAVVFYEMGELDSLMARDNDTDFVRSDISSTQNEIHFDKNGNAELKINPEFFTKISTTIKNRNIYFVTLFY